MFGPQKNTNTQRFIGFHDPEANIFYKIAEVDESGLQEAISLLKKLYPQLPLTSQ
jgi:hypothetical protein